MDPEFRTTFLTNCDGLEEIGHGGFGKVYKYINENGESFAIKKMYQKLDKNTQTNFRKEVSTLRKLNHPNIVKTYGAYTDGSSSYIIFEYLSGGELFQRLSKRKVYTEKDARAIMKILLDTVKYIHSKGIVHRDLKIENILLSDNTEEAIIKIADFGLAADLDSRGLIGVVGTTYYSAPEVHKSERYNEKVDIWSLGVICYVLLSGTYPFTETRNEQTVICNIRRGQYQFHDKHWNKVSKAGKDFVRKLLVVKPEGRLSVDEALDHEWFSIPSIELVASIYSFIKKWRRITRHRAAERKKLLGENNEEEEDNTEQQQAVDDLNDAGDEDDDETTTNNVAEDEDNNHQINANEPTLSGITTTSEIHHHDDATPLPVDHLPALLEGNSSGTSNHVEGTSSEVLDNTEEEEEEEELKPVYSFQISNNKSPKEIDEYEIYGKSKIITTYWEEYTGLHKQDNIEVTVDVYDLVKTPAYLLKNLQNEISLLSCLKIPTQNHMVKYYGTHYKQNKLYIVKEKLYGKEILGRINDMSLKDYNESNIKIWVHDLFHVIHDLHQQNVVHRAILPENIRFTSDGSDGELVLINFQQAKRLHPPSPTKITSFTSPDELEEMESLEQAKAKDMWSLGVLLHLLFIGSTPFSNVQKKDLQSTIKDYKGIDFQHKDTVTQWECISKDGKDLIKRLLEKNPLRRLTIIEACRHPWLAGQNRSVGELKRAKSVQELIPDVTLHHIRRLYILRKFRRTVRVMIFFVRVLRGLGEVLLEKKLARENNNNNDNRNDLLLENNNNEMIEIPLITPPPPPSTSENPPPAPSEGVISPIIRSFVNQFFFRSPGHDSPGSKQQT